MRVEIDVGEAGGAPSPSDFAALVGPRRARRFDWFDLGVFALFAAISVWILALDLWQVVAHGRVWTGTDGVYLVDQMQYLAWIQDASHNILSGNLFVLHQSASDYFQPAVTVSAALTALGLAPWLALLIWKPVAVVCAFLAVRSYCRRSLVGTWPRRAALVLALFFGSFSIVYGSFSVTGDLFLTFLSWGYTFGLLAVGVLVLAILAYERARITSRRLWLPGALGVLASLLHPWQGELLIIIVLVAELVMWRGRGRLPRRLALPIATVVATGIPLLYYMVLGKADPSWALARDAMKHGFSISTILMSVGLLAIPAAFAYRGRSASFLTAATRTWPFAALVVWLLSASQVSATPLHAFDGITIPLAILAVKGMQRLRFYRLPRARLVGALAVAVVTVPATAFLLHSASGLAAPADGNANFVTADEAQALKYLARNPIKGGVVSRFYLGTIVPAATDRHTYVGDCLWSQPNCVLRAKTTQSMLDGSLSAQETRSFVRSTGARFVLADCSTNPVVAHKLGPITSSVRRFGCASVYELDPPQG